MRQLKTTGFYLLSPFMMIFALLFIFFTPDQPELDHKTKKVPQPAFDQVSN